MSDIEHEKESPTFTTLSLEWHVPDNAQSQYANNLLVQSTPHEIIISFFEALPPPLAGSAAENAVKLREMKSIRANLVTRVIVPPSILPAVIGLKCASVSPGAKELLSHFAATLLERPLKPRLCNQLSAENSWQIVRSATSGATDQSVLLFEQYKL